MKILCVLPSVPWAVRVRAYNLLPRLAMRHEIYLVCVSNAAPTEEQMRDLSAYCQRVVHVPHSRLRALAQCVAALPTKTPLRIAYCGSRSAKEAVRRAYEEMQPDVVFVERWRALQYVPEGKEAPVVCDPTDSMTLYNRRLMKAGAWWERLIGWEEHLKFSRYEGNLARRADVTVFCSRVDMECVKEQAPKVQCALVPNGVDCKKYFFKEESEEEPETLVFTGNFKYRPNEYAVEFFMEKIFPLIRREVPEAKFLAVGNAASRELRRFQGWAGFEAIDFVPDLRPYLGRAAVTVAPITMGSGVSNKVLEAFATGTAMVATPMPCGDLPVRNGEHLLIAQDAQQFAAQAVRLLKDAQLRREIAVRARRLVEKEYDLEVVSGKMERVMQQAVERNAGIKQTQLMATA